jgi:hypothetical protein
LLILAEHVAGIFLGLEDEGAIGQLPVHAQAMSHLGLEHAEFNEMAVDILAELSQQRG